MRLEPLSKRAQDEPELELERRAIQAMSGHVRLTNRADELELELLSKRAQDEPELELELEDVSVLEPACAVFEPSCTARLPTSLRMLKKYVSFLRILRAGLAQEFLFYVHT